MGRSHISTRATRRIIASALAVACLLGAAACSTKPDADAAGTTDTGISDAAKAENARLEDTAKRFVACLTDKGIDAKTVESYSIATSSMPAKDIPKSTVVVRRLDQSGNMAGTDATDENGTDSLYPNVRLRATDDDGLWIGFTTSAELAGTPYAAKQQDYAACEQANPDFAQPPFSGSQHADPEVALAELNFARKARAAGFDWYPDPDPTNTGTHASVIIPETTSKEEFRRFLRTYKGDDWPTYNGAPFGITWSENLNDVYCEFNPGPGCDATDEQQ
ncbi:hypothetical protein CPA40_05675 [Bifidobacterium callitrichos]|uniref:Uridine kinase n=1 Tax=Bifidobacterium callitrichos TaxID=762209 RepID=A0A2T3GAM8_9BIFI|nr:hypothetical protein [Bifidobacterium callitrichos]PST46540.1 hypothetical protein CPA40_05675 [Bifidobacterium callitrichos]